MTRRGRCITAALTVLAGVFLAAVVTIVPQPAGAGVLELDVDGDVTAVSADYADRYGEGDDPAVNGYIATAGLQWAIIRVTGHGVSCWIRVDGGVEDLAGGISVDGTVVCVYQRRDGR